MPRIYTRNDSHRFNPPLAAAIIIAILHPCSRSHGGRDSRPTKPYHRLLLREVEAVKRSVFAAAAPALDISSALVVANALVVFSALVVSSSSAAEGLAPTLEPPATTS